MPKKLPATGLIDDENLTVIGLVSQFKDYRLAHFINTRSGLNLTRQDDVQIFNPKRKANGIHSLYFWEDSENKTSYSLIPCRDENNIWLPVSPRTDFLLIVFHENPGYPSSNLVDSLKRTSGILGAYLLPSSNSGMINSILTDLGLQ